MFPLKIALRYLFSKKSTNAINLISAISVTGIMVGSGALVLVMSVLNGFEGVIAGFYSKFNPDIKIIAAEGKVFDPDSTKVARLGTLKGIASLSMTLEETALFEYNGLQAIGLLKGVDDRFVKVSDVDTMLTDGIFALHQTVGNQDRDCGVVGIGMSQQLGLQLDERLGFTGMLTVYMARRNATSAQMNGLSKPFKSRRIKPVGIYEVQPDFDYFIIVPLDFARDLLSYSKEVSAIEIKLQPDADGAAVVQQIQDIMGSGCIVKDRYRQDEAFFKITNLEKWVSYLILSFILLIVVFNMIGTLWMIILDKKKDIAILKTMGATEPFIRNIFLSQGILLSLLGLLAGFTIAITLCLLQQRYGLVKLQGQGTFLIPAYPVTMKWQDFAQVFFTVLFIGGFASYIPALFAGKMKNLVDS